MGALPLTSLYYYYPDGQYDELGRTMMTNMIGLVSLTCAINLAQWVVIAEYGKNTHKEHTLYATAAWIALWAWYVTLGDEERVAAGATYENCAGWLLMTVATGVTLY